MSYLSRSFFLQHLLLFWHWVKELYLESGFHRGVLRIGNAISRGMRRSRIIGILKRDGVLTRAFPDSRLCRGFCKVLDAPGRLMDWLWRKKMVRQSVFVRLFRILGRRTWALISLLFALMLVIPHAAWNNVYGFVGIVLITLLFFLAAAGRKSLVRRLDGERFSVYFVIYAVVLVLGLLFSVHFGLSLRFFLFHVTCLLTVLLLVSTITTKRQLRYLLGILLVGLTICALYGCYQRIIGVDIVASQVDYTLELNQGIPGRVNSFFDNPNNFAEILAMLIPLYLAMFCIVKGWKKWVVFLCMIPALWAIIETYSRSGWIGLAIAVLVFLAFQNWRLIPVCIVLVLVALPFLPQTVLNRIMTIGNKEDSSTMYRFQIYDTLAPMFRDFWLSGAGLGSDTVGEVIRTYPTKLLNGAYPIHSHNTYLQLWLEAGIFAPLAYLGGTFYQIKQGIRGMKQSSPELKYIIRAAIGGLLGVMVIAIVEYTWFYPRVMFLFWLLLGILMAASKLALQEGEAKREAEAAQSQVPPSFEQTPTRETARKRARRLVLRPVKASSQPEQAMEMEDGEQEEREELEEDALSPSPLAGLPPLEREEQFKKWYDLPEPDTLETPLWELKMELDLEEESSSHSPDPTEPPSPEEELTEEEES